MVIESITNEIDLDIAYLIKLIVRNKVRKQHLDLVQWLLLLTWILAINAYRWKQYSQQAKKPKVLQLDHGK